MGPIDKLGGKFLKSQWTILYMHQAQLPNPRCQSMPDVQTPKVVLQKQRGPKPIVFDRSRNRSRTTACIVLGLPAWLRQIIKIELITGHSPPTYGLNYTFSLDIFTTLY